MQHQVKWSLIAGLDQIKDVIKENLSAESIIATDQVPAQVKNAASQYADLVLGDQDQPLESTIEQSTTVVEQATEPAPKRGYLGSLWNAIGLGSRTKEPAKDGDAKPEIEKEEKETEKGIEAEPAVETELKVEEHLAESLAKDIVNDSKVEQEQKESIQVIDEKEVNEQEEAEQSGIPVEAAEVNDKEPSTLKEHDIVTNQSYTAIDTEVVEAKDIESPNANDKDVEQAEYTMATEEVVESNESPQAVEEIVESDTMATEKAVESNEIPQAVEELVESNTMATEKVVESNETPQAVEGIVESDEIKEVT